MKIWTSGARFFGGQIDRIDAGFVGLGHELVQDISDGDLVYCNNAWYDEVIEAKKAGKIKGKIIFTVLDLAPHLGTEFPVAKLEEQLAYADAICSISETVQTDLANRTGKFSRVIYQPIKDIIKTERDSRTEFKALFVGRVNDPNKRAKIAVEALMKLGFKANEILTVGSDQPFYGGSWAKNVSDRTLIKIYNNVDFVMCCSHHEGIGLPAIEAMAAGAIPVICNDLSTRQDFFKGITEYDVVNPNPASIAGFMAGYLNNPEKMQAFKDKLHEHYIRNWAYKMSGKGVAEIIVKTYEQLR